MFRDPRRALLVTLLLAACATGRRVDPRDVVLRYHGEPALACLAGVAAGEGFDPYLPGGGFAQFSRQRANGEYREVITARVIAQGADLGSLVIRAEGQRLTERQAWRPVSTTPDAALLRVVDRMRDVCNLEPDQPMRQKITATRS